LLVSLFYNCCDVGQDSLERLGQHAKIGNILTVVLNSGSLYFEIRN